tara:strand:- start:647 stop:1699 length:1053 start_codon:yes stop_codon:yes gene_type:complete
MKIFKTYQGRSSLYLAFKAIANKNKKLIITQAFTCVAVPEAIIAAGFQPFWVDIELETFSIMDKKLEEILKENFEDVAALLIQHTYGLRPKNYKKIKFLCKLYNVPIIEDRCHCNFLKDYLDILGNNTKEKIAYCYSFENAKPITLGRGGILLINNETKKEIKLINSINNSFKGQNFLQSVLHISIAINYNLFSSGPLYWPLLKIYRKFARLGVLPSNFQFNSEFKLVKIGIIQSLIISFLIILSERKVAFLKNPVLDKVNNRIINYFLRKNLKYPLYVSNKKKVTRYCEINSIPVKDYFNSAIQPLKDCEFHNVFYEIGSCKIAEEAAEHIIVFDKKIDNREILQIKNL